jgi:hypothetical protein
MYSNDLSITHFRQNLTIGLNNSQPTICKYIYKALDQLSSDYSKEFFNYIKRVNTRLGEDQLKPVIPNAKCNFLMNTIFYKDVKELNNLPFEIRNSHSLDEFINCFKSYFKLF